MGSILAMPGVARMRLSAPQHQAEPKAHEQPEPQHAKRHHDFLVHRFLYPIVLPFQGTTLLMRSRVADAFTVCQTCHACQHTRSTAHKLRASGCAPRAEHLRCGSIILAGCARMPFPCPTP